MRKETEEHVGRFIDQVQRTTRKFAITLKESPLFL